MMIAPTPPKPPPTTAIDGGRRSPFWWGGPLTNCSVVRAPSGGSNVGLPPSAGGRTDVRPMRAAARPPSGSVLDDHVVAGPAVEHVEAGAAEQHVVVPVAAQRV